MEDFKNNKYNSDDLNVRFCGAASCAYCSSIEVKDFSSGLKSMDVAGILEMVSTSSIVDNVAYKVAFDVDGHLIDTETYAYPAWYKGLLKNFEDDRVAEDNVERLISPDVKGGKDYFVTHFMGHSHREICEEINKNIAPHKAPMSLDTFRSDLLVGIDDIIADTVTPNSVFPGISDMMDDLKKLEKAGLVKTYYVSGSAVKRLKTSFKNSGLDKYIDSFDAQVYSGENYTNKNDVFRGLANGDVARIMYSGDGYGDAKACKKVVGDEDIFFVGKSEGSHCPANHYETLREIVGESGVVVKNSYQLHSAIMDWLSVLVARDAKDRFFSRPISDKMPDANRALTAKDVITVSCARKQNS